MIVIRNLRKEYPNITPLQNVNAEIKKRRCDLDHRTLGHGKKHAAALYQSSGNPNLRRDSGGRRGYMCEKSRSSRIAPENGHGLSKL